MENNNLYVWQKYLDIENIEPDYYYQLQRKELIDIFTSNRKNILEIGSSSGLTAAYAKETFPDLKYWGFEPNKKAAKESEKYIDTVIADKYTGQDLTKYKITPKSIDGVIMGDVLEHIYNPWQILTSLHPWLSENAELSISIPNIRNLWLMNEIAEGRFEYQANGLLDITHIRFYTIAEIAKMLHQTGYKMGRGGMIIDEHLIEYYQYIQNSNLPADALCNFNYKSINIKTNSNQAQELCAKQFIFIATPLENNQIPPPPLRKCKTNKRLINRLNQKRKQPKNDRMA